MTLFSVPFGLYCVLHFASAKLRSPKLTIERFLGMFLRSNWKFSMVYRYELDMGGKNWTVMGLEVIPVALRWLYQGSVNWYFPHAHIVLYFSNSRFVSHANIHQLQCQSNFELIYNVIFYQNDLRSHYRNQISLSEGPDQELYIFLWRQQHSRLHRSLDKTQLTLF